MVFKKNYSDHSQKDRKAWFRGIVLFKHVLTHRLKINENLLSKTSFFHKPEIAWERFIPYDLTNAFTVSQNLFLSYDLMETRHAIVESYDSSMFWLTANNENLWQHLLLLLTWICLGQIKAIDFH